MKRLASMLLALTVLLTLLSNLSVTVSAESLYIRKIVSVVYDDSGSMNGDKFAYANYAMQAFCGMLNGEDQLFVTYMSDPTVSSEIDLSADGIQNSIDSISSRNCGGSTPYTVVETAYDKLSSVSDSNQNTQYWLVVITDGAFDETNTMSDDNKKSYLNEKIEEYTESVMPNGTNPQIIFLGIGDVILPDENQSDGVYTYSVQSAEEIIDAMSQMADKISGRTRLGSDDIELIDGNKIQVSSSIPLLNIVCFVQGSDAKVTDVVYINETDIPITREADLSYPNYSELVGSAYLIGDSQTVIGSGTYVITFDRDVVLDDIIVLFEPALEMKMTITLNGEEISDFNDLDSAMESDTISVSCKIYEMGTDNEVSSTLLPDGTVFSITISENGNVKASVGEEMEISSYVLSMVETEITAAVTIDNFNPITSSVKFTPAEVNPSTLYSIVASYGDESITSVKRSAIADNKDLTICFTIYDRSGNALTEDEIEELGLNPVITAGDTTVDVEIKKDGMIVFTPTSASSGTGDETVTVTCSILNGTKEESLTYKVLGADYEVVASYGTNNVSSVKFYKIGDNGSLGSENLTVCFTVYADGEEMTDSDAVKALNPDIDWTDGNSGTVDYVNGKIICTPTAASIPSDSDSVDVTVKCSVGGASAEATYTVSNAEYDFEVIPASGSITKTEFYGNTVSISFYILKDGVQLGKDEVSANLLVSYNEEHSDLVSDSTSYTVSSDGIITVTPYSEKEHKLNFFSWWTNWAYYFSISGSDLEVTINNSLGSKTGTIDVVGESVPYLIFVVFLPLGLEILIVALIIAYIIRYFTKPRFAPNGALYVGSISRLRGNGGAHAIELQEIQLNQYNKFKNLWNPFKELTVSVGGVSITAVQGNKICCNEAFPWYASGIKPKARTVIIETPKDVVKYCQENDELVVREIKPEQVIDGQTRILSQDDSVYYLVRADIDYVKAGNKQIEVIDSAVAFCYSTIQK